MLSKNTISYEYFQKLSLVIIMLLLTPTIDQKKPENIFPIIIYDLMKFLGFIAVKYVGAVLCDY